MSVTHQSGQEVWMTAGIPEEEWLQYLEQLEKNQSLPA